MCFRYLYVAAILCNYIQARLVSILLSNHNYILMLGKVGCLVFLSALLVGYLGGSVLKVGITGAVKKKKGDFRFCI